MSGASGIVVFDYATWAGQYPELAGSVNEPQAQGYFNRATFYLDNSPCSPIRDALPGGRREAVLYMLTSHIAVMNAVINGAQPSPLVGRIASAGQGSVNVSTDMPTPESAAWFNQTKYGADAWQAIRTYKTGLYLAPPQIPLAAQSYPFGFVGGWR